jgi:hypothetical protein
MFGNVKEGLSQPAMGDQGNLPHAANAGSEMHSSP